MVYKRWFGVYNNTTKLNMGVPRIRLPVSERISIPQTKCLRQQHFTKYKCK